MQDNYEMFTQAGNRAVGVLIRKLKRQTPKLDTILKIDKVVTIGMAKISLKHDEVYDTEPRNHILDQAERTAQFHGLQY